MSVLLPGAPLQCVYFVNSGSEANDMAMTLARTHTGTSKQAALPASLTRNPLAMSLVHW
jgi:4-aminobutyrate aminotransferase-like enzyme